MGRSITDLSFVTRVGFELAKSSFQLHADAKGEAVVARKARGRLVAFFSVGVIQDSS